MVVNLGVVVVYWGVGGSGYDCDWGCGIDVDSY